MILAEIVISTPIQWALIFAIAFISIVLLNGYFQAIKYRRELEIKFSEVKTNFEKRELELQLNINSLAQIQFEKFKEIELEGQKKILNENAIREAKVALETWIYLNEQRIRKDAANRSVRNVLGKVTEHLIPFSEAMRHFNPKDIRFIGSPIDLIVFNGAEELREDMDIHFIEVKTGTSALSKRQLLIKDAIQNRRIRWMRVNIKDFGGEVNAALRED